MRLTVLMGSVLAGVLLSGAAAAQTVDLKDPATLTEQAPPTYRARFETAKGPFVIEVTREWAPLAADRFYNLVKHKFYDLR